MSTLATLATKNDKLKTVIYQCIYCKYITVTKCNYGRHIMTAKHIQATKNDKADKNDKNDKKNICKICNKVYKDRSGLWRHSQSCNITVFDNEQSKLDVTKTNKIEPKPDVINAIMEVVKQNNEFKELLAEQGKQMAEQNKQMAEQNKQIIELSNKPTTTNNTTNNFNLHFFLNETCKDALNISDFISQLQVEIKDLEETGRLGYAAGISKIFINGLKQLGINQRPVHCSDAKRETIYIKDKNQWEKDDEEKIKLTKAIKSVAHKNIEQIAVWTEVHPEYMEYNSKYNERYMKLIGEAMPGATYEESDKNYKKIARNITKETIIEK